MTTISGRSATEIAESVRGLVDRGVLRPDDALPSVRALAENLDVNRNTVVAAYRQLALAGVVAGHGRGGTRVTGAAPVPQEGFAADSVLHDIGTGNPDPTRIPDPSAALTAMAGRPVLYGEPLIDPGLERWARDWFADAAQASPDLALTITGGASDAIERLLTGALTRDDAVALEDPCFLSSIHTVRLGGYRPLAVPVDDEGMTVDGLRSALAAGARAVVCTPRAQNPTGASTSAARAEALRAVLADHPYVLVIEDDHFSLLSSQDYHSIIGPDHRRWALVRSVSKFLGPDMCLAVTASDPDTAERLAQRLTPGTTWVSHLLQRLVHALMTDPSVVRQIADAGAHYRARNRTFVGALHDVGLDASVGDGLNVWVPLPLPGRTVADHLMRRGWLARPGDEFVLAASSVAQHLRLTVHDLGDADQRRLAADIAAAVSNPKVG